MEFLRIYVLVVLVGNALYDFNMVLWPKDAKGYGMDGMPRFVVFLPPWWMLAPFMTMCTLWLAARSYHKRNYLAKLEALLDEGQKELKECDRLLSQ